MDRTSPRRPSLGARSLARSVVLSLLLPALAVALPGALAAHAVTAQATTLELEGGGFGHGVGLSQWGAYGYAVDEAWTASQILNHYYGGTTASTVALDTSITVRLQRLDGAQTAVVSREGNLVVDGVAGGPWKSVLVREVSALGTPPVYAIWGRADAEVCPASTGDPVASGWTLVTSSKATSAEVRTQVDPYAPTTTFAQLAAVCEPGGTVRTYRGSIRAVNDVNGANRTVNVVRLEHYARSVVAKEMSPGWAYAGPNPDNTQYDRGIEALKAQAVAVRSYALASNHAAYAKTCDSTTCQAYMGAATRTAALGTVFTAVEHVAVDAAVAATAGGVRLTSAGAIAATFFSASNGGYTRPGFGSAITFPAVADTGDDTSLNPNYRWTATLSLASLADRYGFTSVTGVVITANTGPASDPFNGWVTTVRVDGIRVDGSVGYLVTPGDTFRSHWGLKSSRFRIVDPNTPDPCGSRVAPPVGAALGPAAAALFQPVTPVRLVDTRNGTGTAREPLGAGCTLVVDPGAPAEATSVVLNVTAVRPAASAPVTVYACGTPRPTISNLQAVAGRVVASTAVVRVGADGTVCIHSSQSMELVVDLFGHYSPTAGSKYQPITTLRLFDSRNGAKVATGTTLRVKAVRTGGAPAGAAAGAFTLHASDASSNGFVTVFPCTATRPMASSLNATAGVNITNHLQVALNASGEVCIYVAAAMHITLDMSGWFGSSATTSYVAVTPYRAVDSRNGIGMTGGIAAGANRAVTLAPSTSLPAAATVRAVLANVTSTQATASGFITVHPCLSPVPSVSMVRFSAGANAATMVAGIDDASGRWCLYSSQFTHVIIDVTGYWA